MEGNTFGPFTVLCLKSPEIILGTHSMCCLIFLVNFDCVISCLLFWFPSVCGAIYFLCKNMEDIRAVSRCTLPTSKYWITMRRGLPALRLPTEQTDPHVSVLFQKTQSLAEPCQSCMSVQKQGLHHN